MYVRPKINSGIFLILSQVSSPDFWAAGRKQMEGPKKPFDI